MKPMRLLAGVAVVGRRGAGVCSPAQAAGSGRRRGGAAGAPGRPRRRAWRRSKSSGCSTPTWLLQAQDTLELTDEQFPRFPPLQGAAGARRRRIQQRGGSWSARLGGAAQGDAAPTRPRSRETLRALRDLEVEVGRGPPQRVRRPGRGARPGAAGALPGVRGTGRAAEVRPADEGAPAGGRAGGPEPQPVTGRDARPQPRGSASRPCGLLHSESDAALDRTSSRADRRVFPARRGLAAILVLLARRRPGRRPPPPSRERLRAAARRRSTRSSGTARSERPSRPGDDGDRARGERLPGLRRPPHIPAGLTGAAHHGAPRSQPLGHGDGRSRRRPRAAPVPRTARPDELPVGQAAGRGRRAASRRRTAARGSRWSPPPCPACPFRRSWSRNWSATTPRARRIPAASTSTTRSLAGPHPPDRRAAGRGARHAVGP